MKKYTYAEALELSRQYFNEESLDNALSAKVFVDKYALRDNDGNILESTPDDLHDRLAKEFARIDSEKYGLDYDERFKIYRDALDKFARIVPQGSPMAAIGNKYQLMSASNCVVVESPEDSMEKIIDTGKDLAQLYKRRAGVGVDISTLRPDGFAVNNAARTTSGAWSFADFYSYITNMVCQCIAKDQRVLTKTGLKPIQNVIAEKDYVWTKKGWVKVLNVFKNGPKKIFKLTTTDGLEIKTSEDHIFLTEKSGNTSEIKLKDLKPEQKVITIPGVSINKDYIKLNESKYTPRCKSSFNNNVIFPKYLNEDLAYFIGFAYGDGSVERDKFEEYTTLSLACSFKYPFIQDKLCNIAKKLFNLNAVITKGDGALNKVVFNSKSLMLFLKENNILKQKTESIKMPQSIIDSPSSVQMAFLSGFFDADGYASGKKKGYVFNSVCKDWIKSIQTLLMANGISSKIHVEDRTDKGWKNIYSLCVLGTYNQKLLLEKMSDFSHKIKEKNFISRKDCYKTPFFPETFGFKRSSREVKFISWTKDDTISANGYDRLPLKDKDKVLISSTVKSIVEDGVEETFDLGLESEHLFWCEGFYVHNSGRRGALMITMSVHHPDIIKFATMKHDLKKVTGANISVRLSNEFLKAVDEDIDYELRWPVEGTPKYSTKISAKKVWNTIVESATKTAEPGLIMWDNMINNLPAHCYPEFKTISTNPCAEIALSAYDSCRLISINLTGYIKNAFTKDAFFDFDMFKNDVSLAQHMADNLIDLELELIDGIRKTCQTDSEKSLWTKLWNAAYNGRRTGTGTHGLGDTLAQLNLRYDSEEAIDVVNSIYRTLRDTAYETSADLAKERGHFPVYSWEKEKDCEFIKRLPQHILDKMKKYGRRNIALLTQAPTGSISMLSKVGQFNRFGVSSGVEPVFRNFYKRRKKINANDGMVRVDFVDTVGDKWQEFKVYHANVRNYLDTVGGDDNTELPEFFVTSDQIDWMRRVEIQGIEQQYIDHSISSTINLPRGTPSDVVGKLYLESWKKGLKGVTVYVDGSRDGVLVTDESKKEENQPSSTTRPKKIIPVMAPKRPASLSCDIHNITVKGKKWVVLVGLLENDPYEVFMGLSENLSLPKKLSKGKLAKTNKGQYNLHVDVNGEDLVIKDVINTFNNSECAWATRMISTSLRHGVAVDFIVDQLSKDGGINDINKVISRILKSYIKEGQKVRTNFLCEGQKEDGTACKSDNLVYKDGCPFCLDCGWSRCK